MMISHIATASLRHFRYGQDFSFNTSFPVLSDRLPTRYFATGPISLTREPKAESIVFDKRLRNG